MAYQNVGTPRFYVSILQWLKSLGILTANPPDIGTITDKSLLELVDINPASQATASAGIGSSGISFDYTVNAGSYDVIMPNKKNFFMVLGHTFLGLVYYGRKGDAGGHVANNDYVNYYALTSEYNGFSIGIGNNAHDINSDNFQIIIDNLTLGVGYKIGSLLYGTYYDMPHSPDLKLTMSREMDGVKRVRTKGGADLVKHQYTKSPPWGSASPWELYSGNPANQALSRIGRRSWALSFYLDRGDVWGANQYLGRVEWGGQSGIVDSEDIGYGEYYAENILTEESFYSQVIHKTNGGQLPFIFQPDTNDKTNFAICKFDQKSFSFQQISPNLYSVKMKIREVW